MKCQVWKCDVCGREKTYDKIVQMKAKSGSFVTYSNYDGWFPDRKEFDICTTCLEHIGAATRGYVDRDGRSVKPEYTPPPTKPQKKITESEIHMELDLMHDMIWFRYDDVGFCVQVPYGVIKKLKQQKEVKII